MDKFSDLSSILVKRTYIKQGLENVTSIENLLNRLLENRRLPLEGYNEMTITYILNLLAAMDSNNFLGNCGVGEREGRIYSPMVARRHYNFSHGIGRSGDIAEVQPKAAGSSLLYKLANILVHHVLKLSGITKMANAIILPMATGMSLTLCLLTLHKLKPAAKYVIWPRIDQKSCFKCMLTAGLIPLIIENKLSPSTGGDGSLVVTTDIAAIEKVIATHGADSILCVLSTTSCFAPRQPDLIDEIALLCKKHSVGHVVNNAYGLQCKYIAKLINRACTIGVVDAGNYTPNITDKSSRFKIFLTLASKMWLSYLFLLHDSPSVHDITHLHTARCSQWSKAPTRT